MRVILLFFLFNSLYAKDLSYFTIHAGSGDNPTKVQFIVSDSLGRKTGFKSFYYGDHGYVSVITHKEIPTATYGVESIGSLDPNDPNEPESAILDITDSVIKDTYTIQFIGFDNVKYSAEMYLCDINGKAGESIIYEAFIASGTTQQYSIYLDPAPGTPAPVINKQVNFQLLRDDINVAHKLNQIGEEKFASSLIRMINIAENIYDRCEKTDKKAGEKKKKCYRPLISVLRMFVKRLELANKKCDKSAACDEEKEWDNFHKKYGAEKDFKEFFSEWEKDEWHKCKKSCKKFVSEEALDIISSDVNWYVRAIGEELWREYNKEHKPYISNKQKQIFK